MKKLWPWNENGILLAAVALAIPVAVLLRSYWLGAQVLIDDEWHGVYYVIGKSPGWLLTHFSIPGATCIPLNFYVWALGASVGWTETLLRLPAWVFGVLCVGACPLLACQVVGPCRAAWLALLLATSPLLIFYSRICRPYSAVAFFGLAALIAGGALAPEPGLAPGGRLCLGGGAGGLFSPLRLGHGGRAVSGRARPGRLFEILAATAHRFGHAASGALAAGGRRHGGGRRHPDSAGTDPLAANHVLHHRGGGHVAVADPAARGPADERHGPAAARGVVLAAAGRGGGGSMPAQSLLAGMLLSLYPLHALALLRPGPIPHKPPLSWSATAFPWCRSACCSWRADCKWFLN